MKTCKAGHSLEDQSNVYRGYARGKEVRVCRTCRRKNQASIKSLRREPPMDPKALARLRSAWSEGVSDRDLAERFGIHRGLIAAAVSGLERGVER